MKIHIVRQGETLWELAKAYNIPVGRLLEANPNLTESKMLQWGSKIRIPTGKVPVIQASPAKQIRKRKAKGKNSKQKEQEQVQESKEIAFTHSPQVSIDPDIFFLEEKVKASPKKKSYPNPYDYSMMPYYPPPYLSSLYPYSWSYSSGSMQPMPHYPMMPPPHDYHLDNESSSYEV